MKPNVLIILTIVFAAAGIIFWVIGTLFKIMHWPFAGHSLIAGAVMLITAVVILAVWAIRKTSR